MRPIQPILKSELRIQRNLIVLVVTVRMMSRNCRLRSLRAVSCLNAKYNWLRSRCVRSDERIAKSPRGCIATPIVEQNRNCSRVDAGSDQIAIDGAVEIAGSDRSRLRSDSNVHLLLKGTVGVSVEDRNGSIELFGNGKIGFTVIECSFSQVA